MTGSETLHWMNFLAAEWRNHDTVSRENTWLTRYESSEGRRGWMYSGDMRREASMVSSSLDAWVDIVYGADG